MIRRLKVVLALVVGLWGVLGGLGNLGGYEEGSRAVEAVLSMETLGGDATGSPLATRHPVAIALGFAWIWVLKLVGGSLCLVGAARMWRARDSDAGRFAHAKRWAILGCGVLFVMLFFGFSLVAVGPYGLYRSELVSAVELAWAFAGQVGIVMLFLNQRDD